MIPEAGKVNIAMEVVSEFWPQVAPYINEDAVPLSGIAWTYGLCTYPNVADDSWINSRGGKKFARELTLPDSFLWVGMQDRGMSEAMFLMWFREGRKFWFYDLCYESIWFRSNKNSWYEGGFIDGYEVRGIDRYKHSNRRLESALNMWKSTGSDVICGGALEDDFSMKSLSPEPDPLYQSRTRSSPYGELVRRIKLKFDMDAEEFGISFVSATIGYGEQHREDGSSELK